MGFAAGVHFGEPGFDVEDGGASDGIEVFDVEVEAVDLEEAAAGDAKPVRAAHVAVVEDADAGPGGVVAGAAGGGVEVGGVGGEVAGDADDGAGAAPVVVGGFGASADDVGEGDDCEFFGYGGLLVRLSRSGRRRRGCRGR